MLAVQYYALTISRVDINNALTDGLNNNIGGVIQRL